MYDPKGADLEIWTGGNCITYMMLFASVPDGLSISHPGTACAGSMLIAVAAVTTTAATRARIVNWRNCFMSASLDGGANLPVDATPIYRALPARPWASID